jgi:hypothetical protein
MQSLSRRRSLPVSANVQSKRVCVLLEGFHQSVQFRTLFSVQGPGVSLGK